MRLGQFCDLTEHIIAEQELDVGAFDDPQQRFCMFNVF